MRSVTVGLVLLLAGSANAASWPSFSDPDGVFAAALPSTPKIDHDSVDNADGTKIDMLEYTVDRGDTAMVIIISDFRRYPDADHEKVIDGAVSGAASSGTKTADSVDILGNQAGRRVTIVDKDGNQIEDRIFFVRGRLYQVMDVLPAKPTRQQTADARRFAASFHFLP